MEQLYSYFHFALAAVFPLVMVYGGVRDLVSFEIPNWTSLLIAAVFFPAVALAGWAPTAMVVSLSAGLVVLLVGVALFALGVFGGGDAKLLAAGAVWSGWSALPAYLAAVALAGGILALALIILRRARLPQRLARVGWVRRLHGEANAAPYGVAIAAGAVVVFPHLPAVGLVPG